MLYTTVYYFIKAITKMLDMLNGTKNNVFVFIIKWQGRIWLSCYAFSLPVVVLSLPSVVFRLWEVVVVLPTERVLCDLPSMLSVVDYRILNLILSNMWKVSGRLMGINVLIVLYILQFRSKENSKLLKRNLSKMIYVNKNCVIISTIFLGTNMNDRGIR